MTHRLGRDGAGRVLPMPVKPEPPPNPPLPFKAPPELRVDAVGTRWGFVAHEDGWLVAVNHGEFGAGLFWVDRTTAGVQRLDGELGEPVRTVVDTALGTLGVAGLCHGEGCARRTRVYRIERAKAGGERGWKLLLFAEVNGCPAAHSVEPDRSALLLGTCNGLHRVDGAGAKRIAAWAEPLMPSAADGSIARDSDGRYYVSFGRIIARVDAAGEPSWFVPSACASVTMEATGDCRCSAQPQ